MTTLSQRLFNAAREGRLIESLRSRLACRLDRGTDWTFPTDELTRLANQYGSDKGNQAFGRHYYTRFYNQLFALLRDRPITLLEIGLRHPNEHREGVALSLRMWRDFFPCAQLI